MIPGTPPTSARLGWVQAASSWFRKDYDVLGRVFVVTATVRVVLAIHTVVVSFWFVYPTARNRVGLLLSMAAVLLWTFFVTFLLRRPSDRNLWVHMADGAVTCSLIFATPLVTNQPYGQTSLAGYWMAGCCLYAAVLRGTAAGITATLATAMALLMIPPRLTISRIDVVLAILLMSICVGVLITQFKHTITEQERARIRPVALGEWERLARIVHDGALQVLALVEREGPELGPRGLRLAELAHESETQLRNLIRDKEILNENATRQVDLAAALDRFQSTKVVVSTMAGQVLVPRLIAEEVEAALVEALKNVDKHAGPSAKAWVLLDQEDDSEVILWVRDNGVGMDLSEAASAGERGRLGIRDSIVGRMAALGGTAVVKSTLGEGTEWELRFPVKVGEA